MVCETEVNIFALEMQTNVTKLKILTLFDYIYFVFIQL